MFVLFITSISDFFSAFPDISKKNGKLSGFVGVGAY